MGIILPERKKYILALGLEIAVIVVGIFLCLRGTWEVCYPGEELRLEMGSYDGTGGCYIDEQTERAEDAEIFAVKDNIRLKAGSYEVCVEYETDADTIHTCFAEDSTAGNLWTSGAALPAGRDRIAFTAWLFGRSDTLAVKTAYKGTGSLLIKSYTIRRTREMERVVTTVLFLFFLAVDGIVLLRKKYGGDRAALNRIFGLGVICTVVSIPLMVDYIPAVSGEDMMYHLFRIEGVKDGLLAGQFPVRMYPEWLMGHGYADSIMYGKLLLYVPALFRLLGFPVLLCYKLYVFLVNTATCLTAYFCFGRMFENKNLGLFASLLYTTMPYRLYCVYYRASLGEYSAMIFLPILCYGFYRIFTEDRKAQKYKNSWLLPAVGFTGIIQTHVLSCELTGGMVLLVCLVLWKRVFRRETFGVLCKTVAVTVCLNLFFLVPFLEYLSSGELKVSYDTSLIQDRGLHLAHFFMAGTQAGKNGPYLFGISGMSQSVAATVGPALLCALFVFVWLRWSRIGEDDRWVKQGGMFLALALVTAFMSTRYFPWNLLQKAGKILCKLISGIQFPMRFLGLTAAFLVILACASGCIIIKEKGKPAQAGFFGALAALSVLTAIQWQGDLLQTADCYRLYDLSCVGTGHIMGKEYLLAGTNADMLHYGVPVAEGVEIGQYEKEALLAEFTCSSQSGGYVELPMLCYRGYVAEDAENGSRLQIEYGNNYVVRVVVPEGFEGRIRVEFRGKWYWRVAEMLSLATLAWCVLFFAGEKKSLLKHKAS